MGNGVALDAEDQRLEMRLLLRGVIHRVDPFPLVEPLRDLGSMAQRLETLLLGDQRARLRVVRFELRDSLPRDERKLPAEHTPFRRGSLVSQLLPNPSLARCEPRSPPIVACVVTSAHVSLLVGSETGRPGPSPPQREEASLLTPRISPRSAAPAGRV